MALNTEVYVSDYFVGKWYATAEIIKGLKLTANYGINTSSQRYQTTANPYYGQYAQQGGYAEVRQTRFLSTNKQLLATYTNKFDLHNVDVLLGYEDYSFKSSRLSGFKQKLFQPFVAELDNAILLPNTSSSSTLYASLGYLGQVKYDYDSKYYASFSYRRDASSVFAPENRWGNF